LTGLRPFLEFALMGAEENAETQSKAVEPSKTLGEGIHEKLADGWTIQVLQGGQLLLVPPPTYGEPPAA
jgi:hypothetical protein